MTLLAQSYSLWSSAVFLALHLVLLGAVGGGPGLADLLPCAVPGDDVELCELCCMLFSFQPEGCYTGRPSVRCGCGWV